MMKNREVTKLNMYHELLANRYLLSVVLTNLMAQNSMLNSILSEVFKKERKEETKEKGSQTLLKERKEKKKERTSALSDFSDKLEFTSFSLSRSKFDQLLRTYDHDVVMDAIVIVDKLIGVQGRTYKDIPKKVEALCKQLSLREKLIETLDASAREIRKVPVEQIEDETMAKKYIFATPGYLRNVDKGCKFLSEKFNINLDEVRNYG